MSTIFSTLFFLNFLFLSLLLLLSILLSRRICKTDFHLFLTAACNHKKYLNCSCQLNIIGLLVDPRHPSITIVPNSIKMIILSFKMVQFFICTVVNFKQALTDSDSKNILAKQVCHENAQLESCLKI